MDTGKRSRQKSPAEAHYELVKYQLWRFLQKQRTKIVNNFEDTLNPICSFWDDIDTTIQCLLNCRNYLDERRTLLHNLQNVGENIHDKNDFQISGLF